MALTPLSASRSGKAILAALGLPIVTDSMRMSPHEAIFELPREATILYNAWAGAPIGQGGPFSWQPVRTGADDASASRSRQRP